MTSWMSRALAAGLLALGLGLGIGSPSVAGPEIGPTIDEERMSMHGQMGRMSSQMAQMRGTMEQHHREMAQHCPMGAVPSAPPKP